MKRLFLLCLLFPLSAYADLPPLSASWTPPTTREDGSALDSAQIAGYELTITEPDGTETQPFITELAASFIPIQIGTHQFCVKTKDTDGLTSSETCASTSLIPPSAPGMVIIITVGN